MGFWDPFGGGIGAGIGPRKKKAAQKRSLSNGIGAGIGPRRSPSPPPVRSNPTGRYSAPSAPPSSRSGPVAPIKPAAPDINSFLTGDTNYQQQLRQFSANMSQFLADLTRRRGTLNTEYGVSNKALGEQKVKDLELLEDDYGSRGILRSGLYGKAVGDYEEEHNERVSELERSHKQALGGLESEKGRFTSQNKLKQQEAREAAIRRRAEKYGL